MAHITEDRLLEYSNSTGTGDFTVIVEVPGYAPLSSKLASGDTFHYLIQGVSGGALTGEYEYGLGTWNGPDFARTTPYGGSAALPVSFSAGTKQVALVILAPNSDTAPAWRDALALGDAALVNFPGGTTAFLRADGTFAIPAGGGGGTGDWGSIGGVLSDQTDLQLELDGKEPVFAAGSTGQFLRWDKTYAAVAYSQVTGTPTLATVATTGAYSDLTGLPTLFSGAWVDITGKPTFATVATTGAYADLTGKPTIPAAQVNSDWAAASGVAMILNKPTLFSGAYADLTGKPTLGTVAALSYPGGTSTYLRADGTWTTPAGGGSTGVFPFYNAAGTLDTIALVGTGTLQLPFFDSTGAADNIDLV